MISTILLVIVIAPFSLYLKNRIRVAFIKLFTYKRNILSLHVLMVGFCLSALSLPSSNATSKDEELIQDSIRKESRSELELVQIAVMDEKGKPITDLQLRDFVLYDNGKPQDLTVIENHNISTSNDEQLNRQGADHSINPLIPRRIFFLFDFTCTNELGFLLARDSAIRFIENKLLPSDEVGVISFSGRRAFKLYEFQTRDRLKIENTIESFGLQDLNPVIPANDVDKRFVDRKFIITDQAVWAEVQESAELIIARNFVWALASFAQSLRDLPGQKNIILFSGGIPINIYNRPERSKYHDNIDYPQLYKEMTASNIVVYSSYIGPRDEEAKYTDKIIALKDMAIATGGQYYSNVREAEQYLNSIQNLTGTYYVLGYRNEIMQKEDFHDIKISVNRPGCVIKILFRYSDNKPFNKYSEVERQLHLIDIALAEIPFSQIPIKFKMKAFVCNNSPPHNLRIIAEIPLDKLEDIVRERVEIISLVFNDADNIVDYHYVESDLAIYKDKRVFLDAILSVPFGDFNCRTILRNHSTGQAATAAVTIHIPKPKDDDLVIFPPIFYLPEKDAINLSGESIGSTKNEEMFLFNPTQYIPCIEKSFKRNTEIWAIVYCHLNKGYIHGLRLSAFLIDRNNGNEIPIPITMAGKSQEKEKKTFFIKLNIPDLEPDTYAFNILATNLANMHYSQIGTSVIIE